MVSGKHGAQPRVLHSDFDGNGPPDDLFITEATRDQVAEEETAGVQRKNREQQLCGRLLGMTKYCEANPMATTRGIRSTRLKSSRLSVRPMPSMMTASPQVIHPPLNQENACGNFNAAMPAATTHTGKRLVRRLDRRIMPVDGVM